MIDCMRSLIIRDRPSRTKPRRLELRILRLAACERAKWDSVKERPLYLLRPPLPQKHPPFFALPTPDGPCGLNILEDYDGWRRRKSIQGRRGDAMIGVAQVPESNIWHNIGYHSKGSPYIGERPRNLKIFNSHLYLTPLNERVFVLVLSFLLPKMAGLRKRTSAAGQADNGMAKNCAISRQIRCLLTPAVSLSDFSVSNWEVAP